MSVCKTFKRCAPAKPHKSRCNDDSDSNSSSNSNGRGRGRRRGRRDDDRRHHGRRSHKRCD